MTVVANTAAHETLLAGYGLRPREVVHLRIANSADEPKDLLLGADLVVRPGRGRTSGTAHFVRDTSVAPRYEFGSHCDPRVQVPPKGVTSVFVCYDREPPADALWEVTLRDWELRPLRQETVVGYFS